MKVGRQLSPGALSRTVSVIFLVLLFGGMFSMIFVQSSLIVPGDARATAGKVKESTHLLSAGMAVDLVIVLAEVVMTPALYELFKPVHGSLSLFAAVARGAMAVLIAANVANYSAVLIFAGDKGMQGFLQGSDSESLIYFFMRLHDSVVQIWESLFGFHLLILSFLVYQSGFTPRAFGLVMVIGGSGYLLDCFGNILLPSCSSWLSAIAGCLCFLGEIPFFVYVLFAGIDEDRWWKLTNSAEDDAPLV